MMGALLLQPQSAAAQRRGSVSRAGQSRQVTTTRRPAARAGYRAGYRAGARNSWYDARRSYYRWRTVTGLFAMGMYFATRPRVSTTVVVTGTSYYYTGGVFYVSSGTTYTVVAAPPGAVVYAVPAHTTVVYVGDAPYYYNGGTYESPDIKVGRSQRTGSTCAVSPAHLSSSNNHRLNTLRRLLAAAEQAPQPERGLRRRPSTEARKYCSGRSQKNP